MKRWKKWLLAALAVLALLCVLWCLLWTVWGFSPSEAASLGVIGGADGPTAIITAKIP